jgi:hypothetical protein
VRGQQLAADYVRTSIGEGVVLIHVLAVLNVCVCGVHQVVVLGAVWAGGY